MNDELRSVEEEWNALMHAQQNGSFIRVYAAMDDLIRRVRADERKRCASIIERTPGGNTLTASGHLVTDDDGPWMTNHDAAKLIRDMPAEPKETK